MSKRYSKFFALLLVFMFVMSVCFMSVTAATSLKDTQTAKVKEGDTVEYIVNMKQAEPVAGIQSRVSYSSNLKLHSSISNASEQEITSMVCPSLTQGMTIVNVKDSSEVAFNNVSVQAGNNFKDPKVLVQLIFTAVADGDISIQTEISEILNIESKDISATTVINAGIRVNDSEPSTEDKSDPQLGKDSQKEGATSSTISSDNEASPAVVSSLTSQGEKLPADSAAIDTIDDNSNANSNVRSRIATRMVGDGDSSEEKTTEPTISNAIDTSDDNPDANINARSRMVVDGDSSKDQTTEPTINNATDTPGNLSRQLGDNQNNNTEKPAGSEQNTNTYGDGTVVADAAGGNEKPTEPASAVNGRSANGSVNAAAGRIATGDSTNIAMLLFVIMAAAGITVIVRRKIKS